MKGWVTPTTILSWETWRPSQRTTTSSSVSILWTTITYIGYSNCYVDIDLYRQDLKWLHLFDGGDRHLWRQMPRDFRCYQLSLSWARALWCPCKELELGKKPRPFILFEDWVVHKMKVRILNHGVFVQHFCPREKVFWTNDKEIVDQYLKKQDDEHLQHRIDLYSDPEWRGLELKRHAKGEDEDYQDTDFEI